MLPPLLLCLNIQKAVCVAMSHSLDLDLLLQRRRGSLVYYDFEDAILIRSLHGIRVHIGRELKRKIVKSF